MPGVSREGWNFPTGFVILNGIPDFSEQTVRHGLRER
jgi:hypothetical protein